MGGVRDPGRGVDQLPTDCAGAGPGVTAPGQRTGGAGEVVGDGGAGQPGGVRSEPARVAQYLLSYRGYSLVPDGYFGPASADAAARYQRARGLVADGVIGPVTWPVLTPDVRRGASGRHVRAVQVGLNTWGARLIVDGDFGSVTDGAVRTFQSRNGLVVDGWVGNTTWSYLV